MGGVRAGERRRRKICKGKAHFEVHFKAHLKTHLKALLAAAVAAAVMTMTGVTGAASETVPKAGTAAADAGAAPSAPQFPVLHAQAAVLMDADSGRVLFSKNGDQALPMASTTKIMTCILALENGNLADAVEVSARAAAMPDVQLGIREGERYELSDLLYSLMLESHNDSAMAIAEHIGGTAENFAAMMNQKARDLGCRDTWFVTPNGLDGQSEDGRAHGATAEDMARIMRYCIAQSPRRQEFLDITRTASRSFTDESGKRSFYCGNHNAYLTMSGRAMSGKTGFTGKAGYCYVGAVRDGDKTFVAALLGCGWPPHKTWKWADMRALEAYAAENYEYRTVGLKGAVTFGIPVKDGAERFVTAAPAPSFPAGEGPPSMAAPFLPSSRQFRFLARRDEEVTVRQTLSKVLDAPVTEGQQVGSLNYYVGDDLAKTVPICASRSVPARGFFWYLKNVFQNFLHTHIF